ncbi:MAG: polysaccharide biosynthesis/export family protein [Chromatiales bacterium]|nr:polysaccharide biosynthesis/export family protein [Chromatiales bacterium]
MINGLRAGVSGLIVAILALTGTAWAADEAPRAAAPAATVAGGYGVNPGDILEISVWREEGLQKQVIVRPDGYFSFPLTGDIRAEGRTIEDIRRDVATSVSRFVPDPVVSIAILEPRGSKVYIIGQVNRAGEYPINRFVDVVQAISMAGGFTPFAQLDNIKILRREGTTQTAIPFSYGDIAAGKRLQQNIVLKPGDTVLVP